MKRSGPRWGAKKGATTTRGEERKRPAEGPTCRTCPSFLYPEEIMGGDGDQCSSCAIRARRGVDITHVIRRGEGG